ncbi:MAG TPA: HK97 family phage prohead protease [Gemmatimonadales bacterium]|nr:HK97 family phage prohead protease [Gemmatimonadales bacterium]
MERKSLDLELKDESTGEVEARFARLNVADHDGDVTLPGAFEAGTEVPITHYGHQTYLAGALPVGKGTLYETGDEVRLRGRLFLDTQAGRDHFAVLKHLGRLQQWSYEFEVLKRGEVSEDLRAKGVRRVLEKVRVFGVAPVLVGAGVDTATLAVKAEEPKTWIRPSDGKVYETFDACVADNQWADDPAAYCASIHSSKSADERIAAHKAAEDRAAARAAETARRDAELQEEIERVAAAHRRLQDRLNRA